MVPLKDAHRAHIPAESDHKAILIQYSDCCGSGKMWYGNLCPAV